MNGWGRSTHCSTYFFYATEKCSVFFSKCTVADWQGNGLNRLLAPWLVLLYELQTWRVILDYSRHTSSPTGHNMPQPKYLISNNIWILGVSIERSFYKCIIFKPRPVCKKRLLKCNLPQRPTLVTLWCERKKCGQDKCKQQAWNSAFSLTHTSSNVVPVQLSMSLL